MMFTKLTEGSLPHVCSLETEQQPWHPKKGDKNYRKRKIRSWFLISNSHRLTSQYFRSQTAIELERKRHYESSSWYIIHPLSSFRMYWERIMCVAYAIAFLMLPFIRAFNPKGSYYFSPHLVWPDIVYGLLCLIIFVVDMILSFFTGRCLKHSKKVVLKQSFICKNYLKTHFIFDLLSVFPSSIFNIWTMEGVHRFDCQTLHLFRIVRLCTFNEYLDQWMVLNLGYRVWRLILKCFIVVHWIACLMVLIPVILNTWFDQKRNNWLKLIKNEIGLAETETREHLPRFTVYIMAMHRSLAHLLNAGPSIYDKNSYEDLICGPIFSTFGLFYIAYVTVAGIHIALSRQVSHIKYLEIMNQLQEYMRHQQLPLNIQTRLVSFYEYRFQNKYFRENTITASLSNRLKQEISLYCCRRLVENVDLFNNLPRHVIGDIIDCLKAEVFLPNDIIIKAGNAGDCMYFLSSGTVAVYTMNGKEVCHLEDGAYFGEIALLMPDQKRVATVVAIEICEVYRLDRRNFRRSFAIHKELYERIEKNALVRMESVSVVEEKQRLKVLGRTHTPWTNSSYQISKS